MDPLDDQERGAAYCAEEREAGNTPEDEGQVEVVGDFAVGVRFGDAHGEDGVADEPDDDHVGADGAVVVFLLLGLADGDDGDFDAIAEVAQGLVVAGVDVELLRGHFEFDNVFGLCFCVAEIGFGHVVALGAPGDVVRVAEGVDLQCGDVGWE